MPTGRNPITILFVMGWAEGFEPSATGTTIRRSTKLSYAHREGNPSIVTSGRRGCKLRVRCTTWKCEIHINIGQPRRSYV